MSLVVKRDALIGTLENSEDSFEITDGKVLMDSVQFVTKIKMPLGYH